MFQGLKIAVKRQKKLLVIFLIFIFLPSVSLSIFGIIALRNEKFRLSKEIENEQLEIVSNLQKRIKTRLTETEKRIENIAGNPSARRKDYPLIKEQVRELSEMDSLAGITFLLYENEEPVFPLFLSFSNGDVSTQAIVDDNSLQQQIKNAQDAEFIYHDYPGAASIYHDLFLQSENRTLRARMLNHEARNLMKAGKFPEANAVYAQIINDYPVERTESGLPIQLHAELQKTECYILLKDTGSAVKNDLDIFEELIINRWDLSESQFRTYSSMVTERLTELLPENVVESPENISRFTILQEQNQQRIKQWETISNIRSYIVPELAGYLPANSSSPLPPEYIKKIGNEDYLILMEVIPGQDQSENAGILGVKLNSHYLRNHILPYAIEAMQPMQNTALYIATLSGNHVIGDSTSVNKNNTTDEITTTALFDNNFPPWRLELAYVGPRNPGEINIFENFFFWTIITLIIILVFGTVLIARIVNREMEILKIKSDFVSSVSHEFKTPLTSMKSLTERLEKGKVIQPEKMKQYVSVISGDIDKLIRLVSNILNFSKIEEGQKVYKMERTDMTAWIKEIIDHYKEQSAESDYQISLQVENDIPALYIDKDAMGQTVFNLLENAFKFSPDNKKAELTMERNSDSVTIKIKNQGLGIDEDEKDRIFEKFYRGNSAVKHSIKGTGLGLALVKYTVEAHNGIIEVESEPGWNTVFSITLPIPDH